MEADLFTIFLSITIILASAVFAVCASMKRMEQGQEEEKQEEQEEEKQEEEQEQGILADDEKEIIREIENNILAEEIPKSDLDYLKAQLAFYREERGVCEGKMGHPSISLENYNVLKKYWEGLTTLIAELEEIIG